MPSRRSNHHDIYRSTFLGFEVTRLPFRRLLEACPVRDGRDIYRPSISQHILEGPVVQMRGMIKRRAKFAIVMDVSSVAKQKSDDLYPHPRDMRNYWRDHTFLWAVD
jgi:hypothetical protein